MLGGAGQALRAGVRVKTSQPATLSRLSAATSRMSSSSSMIRILRARGMTLQIQSDPSAGCR